MQKNCSHQYTDYIFQDLRGGEVTSFFIRIHSRLEDYMLRIFVARGCRADVQLTEIQKKFIRNPMDFQLELGF